MEFDHENDVTDDLLQKKPYSRREFLKIAGVAGAALGLGAGLGGVVAACGGGEETTTTTAGATTTTAGATTTVSQASTTTAVSEDKAAAALAEIKAHLDAYMGIPVWKSPGEPITDIGSVKGKVFFDIPLSNQIPFIMDICNAQKMIAEQAGMKYVIFPNQGSPQQHGQGIQQAVSQKADIIALTAGPNPATFQPQLLAAKAAGVPVLATHLPYKAIWPEGTVAPETYLNVIGVPGNFLLSAQLEAEYVLAATEGKANTLYITSEDVHVSKGKQFITSKTYTDFADKSGIPNKVTIVNVPVNDWATKIQGETQSALVKDPTITWVNPIYDSMCLQAVPGVIAAGQTGKTKVISFNGTLAILKMIEDGDVMECNISEDPAWLGYIYMYHAFRVLTGMPPVEFTGQELPDACRIIDSTNVAETGTPPVASQGYGDYVPKFKELYGLA